MDTQSVNTFQAMLTAMVVDTLKQDECKVLIHKMIANYMDNSFDIKEFTEELRDDLISDVTDYVRENATFDIR
jgi:hypothetical protein